MFFGFICSLFIGVLVIGATNKPWRLNSDVIKVFQKRIYVPLPDAATRALIFQMNIQREPSIEEINDDEIRYLQFSLCLIGEQAQVRPSD